MVLPVAAIGWVSRGVVLLEETIGQMFSKTEVHPAAKARGEPTPRAQLLLAQIGNPKEGLGEGCGAVSSKSEARAQPGNRKRSDSGFGPASRVVRGSVQTGT